MSECELRERTGTGTERATEGPVPRERRWSDGLPWAALVTMSLTVFVVVSGEMMPAAVLPQMADGLEVSLARAGLLVTAWAAMVVLASFPLTRLTSKIDRPTVVAGALTVFGVATLATAAAQSYSVAMGSRLVAAAATALLWSTVNAHAASVVPRERIARATAVVLFGGTLGTVGAIPAGNAVADVVGWRAPFAMLGGLALVTAVPVLVLLRPSITMQNDEAAPASSSRAGLMPVVSIATLGGLVLVAHFIPFTFVVELLEPSQIPTPALLLVIGVVGAAGVVLVGATSDRYPGAVPAVMALGMAVSVASLTAIGRHGGLDLTVILVWGVVIGAVGQAVQAGLMRVAGPEHRGTAGALMPVAMNLGIAVGAAVGSGVVDRWSPAVLPLLAVVPALIAFAGFAVLARGTLQRTGGHLSHLDMQMSDKP